jgi:hypothetical protein
LAEFGGMVDVKAKRRAIILVASGIDTFSKTNYDEARKIIQNSGIPIYIKHGAATASHCVLCYPNTHAVGMANLG